MAKYILVINPGSTSTKIALFEEESVVFENKISHSTEEIHVFRDVASQFEFRKNLIIEAVKENGFDLNRLDAVCGRGGLLKPIEGGTYIVNDEMIKDLTLAERGEHASNLGGIIARDLADDLNIPAYIVDPVAVDEMHDIARISGMPLIERPSLFHALNQKAIAREVAKDKNVKYENLNMVMAHLGGGISVAAHHFGRVVDVNNALDGEGPMSPERSGTVPMGPLYKMAFSGDYTLDEIKKMNYGKGGLVAYLGTNDAREIVERIENGDEKAKLYYDAMAYQIAKEIGAYATVLKGKLDCIVLTGGLAHEKYLVSRIKERIEFISEVLVYPGENELLSLAQGALRVLKGEEEPKTY
ncbi:butyrate kinase [Haloplasma contractile]|uniref:Probable butyrate kinase n=1 Tax=Haloplasma contractile SSD-17B TaxID=1033810 RepID=U2DT01_9MOLU|nr:butyrate kinase [Haloplasma contractile]ERJ11622.1 putative butyrate kinase protein [Haloplasma contractile SSD-17B]